MLPRPALAILLASPLFADVAHAQASAPPPRNGYDGNIDLIRPFFAPESLPGIDVPVNHRGGSVRWGLAAMYTNSPLVLYQFEEEVGSIVNNRFTTFLGASVDITRAFTARFHVPMHFQWGTEVPRYAADGFAFGDLEVGAHWAFWRNPVVSLGVRLDVSLPTARRGFYVGETLPALNPAFLTAFDVGRVRIASDLGVNARLASIATTEDLVLGTELAWNVGVRVNAIEERLHVGAGVYSRFGFADFFGAEETSGEFLVNLAYKATPWLWIDVAGGRGFTKGYGTSDARGFLQLRFQKLRPELPPEDPEDLQSQEGQGGKSPIFVVQPGGGTVVAPSEGGMPTREEWEAGQLVRQEAERIKIRYAIQFRKGTAELLPESYPTVDAIADMLNNDARIGHVVIEGHASEDGPYDLNYRLSLERATSIWRRLVEQGVHPSRLSVRGMGEVMPAEATGGYDELQASRRVVFHIVRQFEDYEKTPVYPLDQIYPWNGERYRAVQPRLPGETTKLPGIDDVDPGGDRLEDVHFAPDDDLDLDEAPADEPTPAPTGEESP